MRGDLRTRKTVKRCSHVFARLSSHGESLTVEFVLPPSLAAGLAVRYSSRVVRSPAAHAPGVRSGRSCRTQPTRPWESPVRPAVGSGRSSHTRLQQPALRSASGRVLSPPYAVVRPNARSSGRVVSVRHARPAAHTLRAVVRSAAVTRSSAPVQSISQRGRQRLSATATRQPPHATGSRPPVTPPATDAQQRPTRSRPRAATASLATRTHIAPPESACGLLTSRQCLDAAEGQPRKPTDRHHCSQRRPNRPRTPERVPPTPPRRTTWSGTPRPPW